MSRYPYFSAGRRGIATCLPTLLVAPLACAFLLIEMSTYIYNNNTITNTDNHREMTINVPAGTDINQYIRTFFGKEQVAEDVTPADEPASTEEVISQTPRGRKTQRLFIDEQTAKHEKSRLLNFLHQHNLGSREFDSSEDSAVNQIAACFYRQWDKRKLLDEKAGSTAYVRFLKNECGLPVSVLEKALANVLSRMIFGDDRYPNWSGEIGAYFQK